MYGNTYPASATALAGVAAATSGWTVAGLCLLGTAVIAASVMTAMRLARRNRN